MLEIKSGKNMSNWDDLQEAILSIFEEEKINLEESFADRRTYSVLQSAVKSLGEVFASLEKRKSKNTKGYLTLLKVPYVRFMSFGQSVE